MEPSYEYESMSMAVYVIVDKANDIMGVAAMSSEGEEIVDELNCDYSYMQVGLALVTKLLLMKIARSEGMDLAKPIDIQFCTNHANLAKAITRSFIMGRTLYQDGVDPIRELKKRGKDIDAYLPLIQAIAKLYELHRGVRQIGYVGDKANRIPLFNTARRHVQAMGIKVGCTALKDDDE